MVTGMGTHDAAHSQGMHCELPGTRRLIRLRCMVTGTLTTIKSHSDAQ